MGCEETACSRTRITDGLWPIGMHNRQCWGILLWLAIAKRPGLFFHRFTPGGACFRRVVQWMVQLQTPEEVDSEFPQFLRRFTLLFHFPRQMPLALHRRILDRAGPCCELSRAWLGQCTNFLQVAREQSEFGGSLSPRQSSSAPRPLSRVQWRGTLSIHLWSRAQTLLQCCSALKARRDRVCCEIRVRTEDSARRASRECCCGD